MKETLEQLACYCGSDEETADDGVIEQPRTLRSIACELGGKQMAGKSVSAYEREIQIADLARSMPSDGE